MLNKWKLRHEIDGLNSLQYSVNKVEFREAYTWILVSIDMEKVMKVNFTDLQMRHWVCKLIIMTCQLILLSWLFMY